MLRRRARGRRVNEKTTARGRGPRFPLRWKLTGLAIGLVTVPLVAVGLGLIDVNEDTVDDLSLEVQLAVVEDTTKDVAAQLGAVENALETVGC